MSKSKEELHASFYEELTVGVKIKDDAHCSFSCNHVSAGHGEMLCDLSPDDETIDQDTDDESDITDYLRCSFCLHFFEAADFPE